MIGAQSRDPDTSSTHHADSGSSLAFWQADFAVRWARKQRKHFRENSLRRLRERHILGILRLRAHHSQNKPTSSRRFAQDDSFWGFLDQQLRTSPAVWIFVNSRKRPVLAPNFPSFSWAFGQWADRNPAWAADGRDRKAGLRA